MLGLTIKQLNEIMKGELSFGSMPPLDGGLREISRMIPAGEKVLENDVVAVGGTLGLQPEGFAEAAFMEGAQGVISSRHVTPWDGGFAIRVPCVRTAIAELARWQRSRFSGLLVGIVYEAESSVFQDTLKERFSPSCDSVAEVASSDLLWRLVELRTDRSIEMIQLSLPNCCDQSIAIAAPDVIVVPPPENGQAQAPRHEPDTLAIDVGLSMLGHVVNEHTTIVAPSAHAAWCSLGESRGARFIPYDGERLCPENLVDHVAETVHQALTQTLESA